MKADAAILAPQRVPPVGAAAGALALAALGACPTPDEGEDEPPAAEPVPAPGAQVEAEVAAIEDALPEELRGEIEFEARALEGGDIVAVYPRGWEPADLPWARKPPEESELGFQTRFGLGTGCAGECEPKDWERALAHYEFSPYTESERFRVQRDDRFQPNARLVTAERGGTLFITAAWWDAGASHYAFCRAILDGEAVAAAEAFERACAATRVATRVDRSR